MNSNYVLPITIVVAGALIAGAVFLAGSRGGDAVTPTDEQTVRPLDSTDRVLGNPNAQVVIVEYADLECQYCKEFHTTMHQVMEYYGQNGNVAWVFRHFPLAQAHPKAVQEAEAAECAAELGGTASFFQYVDKVYEVTPSNNGLDLALLPQIAAEIGLNQTAFNECLQSGRHADAVTASFNEAIAAGGRGTPYTLIMVNGELVEGGALSGAQPYSSMRAIVDTVLEQLGAMPTETGGTPL